MLAESKRTSHLEHTYHSSSREVGALFMLLAILQHTVEGEDAGRHEVMRF